MAEPASDELVSKEWAMRMAQKEGDLEVGAGGKVGFSTAFDIAKRGFDRWSTKEHNQRWWRKIDGTPIPNDLLVNIAAQFSEELINPVALELLARLRVVEAERDAAIARTVRLADALTTFAWPPAYVFDKPDTKFVLTPMPDGWIGGGWWRGADFARARAALSEKDKAQ